MLAAVLMVSGCATGQRAQVGPVVVGDAQGQPAPGFAVRLGQTVQENPLPSGIVAVVLTGLGYVANDQHWFGGGNDNEPDKPVSPAEPTVNIPPIQAGGDVIINIGPGAANGGKHHNAGP